MVMGNAKKKGPGGGVIKKNMCIERERRERMA